MLRNKKLCLNKNFLYNLRKSIATIYFDPPETEVVWVDDTSTIVKCNADDEYDPDLGFYLCVLKRLAENNNSYKGKYRNIIREKECKYYKLSAYFGH